MCYRTKRFQWVVLLTLLFTTYAESTAQSPEPKSYLNTARPFPGPQVYKDPVSSILFYVESDGRHVVAIDREGKILWHKDPFPEKDRNSRLFKDPRIVAICKLPKELRSHIKAEGDFILLNYTTTHAFAVNTADGACIFLGND